MTNRHQTKLIPDDLVSVLRRLSGLVLAGALVSACIGATPAVAPAPTGPATAAPTAIAAAPSVQPSLAPAETSAPTTGATASPTPTAAPTPAPTPTPTPRVLDPAPKAGKFAMDVYRRQAHVRQVTNSMCVPASMQIMVNLMSAEKPDRSRETQRELYTLARSYSPWLTEERGGASARGWAAGLDQLGYGDFELMSLPTMTEALHAAARQMRLTDKPVGLLVWRGDHAWVMSGFEATADPAWTNDFDVIAVWIEDPWFGRTDRTWGTGLEPHSLLTVEDMSDDFVSWPSRWYAPIFGTESRFVIVAPLS